MGLSETITNERKAVIYCFSGTGNTRRMSQIVLDEFEKRGISGTLVSIDIDKFNQGDFPNANEFDFVGISYPIYGFNAPYLVNSFVKKLASSSKGQKAFILKSSGEPFKVNNPSSSIIKRLLKRKGYKVVFERHYLMPYNIMFRYPDSLAKQMVLSIQKHAPYSVDRILGDEKNKLLSPGLLGIILSFICKLVWVAGPLFGKMYSVKKDKCTKCGKCIKSCPMNNISRDKEEYPCFGWHCMLCQSCVMKCPEDAIHSGIMNPWKVNGEYKFEKILNDDNINKIHVDKDTKGYFKNFYKYFKTIDKEVELYNSKQGLMNELNA